MGNTAAAKDNEFILDACKTEIRKSGIETGAVQQCTTATTTTTTTTIGRVAEYD
jgi:hypothetical protein